MRRLRQHCRIAITLTAMGVVVACSVSLDENQRKAQEIWKAHEAVVAQAVRGEFHDADEFIEAVSFLSEVSGIDIRVEMYTLGFMPIAETEGDFEKVRAWYEENADRLDYDPETGIVFVRAHPDGGSPSLRTENIHGSVTVHIETSGEYPSGVSRLLLQDARGETQWEVRRSAGRPQLWRVRFRAGENPSQPEGVPDGGSFRVVVPRDRSSFYLESGREYVLTVWSLTGRSSWTAHFELPAPAET